MDDTADAITVDPGQPLGKRNLSDATGINWIRIKVRHNV